MALMYLVDTNIISEMERLQANEQVMKKLQHHHQEMALNVISWHELLYGYHLLPPSKRKQRVYAFIETIVRPTIPILPFNTKAAEWFAQERARLQRMGQTPSYPDGQIAAIAAVNNLTLVTRNTADFAKFTDLKIENWFVA